MKKLHVIFEEISDVEKIDFNYKFALPMRHKTLTDIVKIVLRNVGY